MTWSHAKQPGNASILKWGRGKRQRLENGCIRVPLRCTECSTWPGQRVEPVWCDRCQV